MNDGSFLADRSYRPDLIKSQVHLVMIKYSAPPAPAPNQVGISHIALSIVSTEGRRPERRDLLSTTSRLSWREGLSATRGVYPERSRGALRSRRRKLLHAIALLAGERNMLVPSLERRCVEQAAL